MEERTRLVLSEIDRAISQMIEDRQISPALSFLERLAAQTEQSRARVYDAVFPKGRERRLL